MEEGGRGRCARCGVSSAPPSVETRAIPHRVPADSRLTSSLTDSEYPGAKDGRSRPGFQPDIPADLHISRAAITTLLHAAGLTREQRVLSETAVTVRSRRRGNVIRQRDRWKHTIWVFFLVLNVFILAEETHHPGATCRLLSVPKAHTSARLLCRKTSLLSGATTRLLPLQHTLDEWLLAAAECYRVVRRRRRRRRIDLPSVAVWRLFNATQRQEDDVYGEILAPENMRRMNLREQVSLPGLL